MGQYYRAALIKEDEIKVVSLDGCKLMEHAWIGGHTMNAIELLLKNNPHRVLWVGDYSQCSPIAWYYNDSSKLDTSNLDELDVGRFEDVFLINHNRECYINLTQQKLDKELQDGYKNVVHPLPLLCRAESEEAGGDYHGETNKNLLGIWCGDLIEIKVLKTGEALDYPSYIDKTKDLFFKED